VESLKGVVNQNREEIENKLEELTREVRTVTAIVDECNGDLQRDKKSHRLDIQRIDAQIEELKEKLNSSIANKAETTVRASPKTSPTIRSIDIGRPTCQVAQNVRGTNSCNSIGEIDEIVDGTSESNEVRNLNKIGATSTNIVSALPDRYVDASQYNELSLPKFTDSSQQVAVHFVRELDEYLTLKKTPEELRLPLVFRAISDPFAKQWMLTAYGKMKTCDDFKREFTELLWDSTRQAEIRCKVYQDRYDHRAQESFAKHYIRYATMASMLSPVMSDQDLLSAQ
jgi:hypothetical protein